MILRFCRKIIKRENLTIAHSTNRGSGIALWSLTSKMQRPHAEYEYDNTETLTRYNNCRIHIPARHPPFASILTPNRNLPDFD